MAWTQSYIAVGTLIAANLACAAPAPAGVVPNFGFDFVTIGDTGNPAWPGPTPVPGEAPTNFGDVNYLFRITRTEVTAGQWFEFVLAYAPFVAPQAQAANDFTSSFITFIGPGADGVPQYVLEADAENLPTTMSWRFAARFCNWLHNDKNNEQSAFESGVYDTSTFGEGMVGKIGTITDQPKHDPGARFWIPTLDEWMKAVYWDPNKDGAGTGGWWSQPNGSDTPLISGPPGVGETSAGPPSLFPLPPVGAYPNVQSPWGLLDASGSRTEMLEDFAGGFPRNRYRKGSFHNEMHHYIFDDINFVGFAGPTNTFWGLRLASRVTEPVLPALADLNQDGVVNSVDLATLLANWGPCTTKSGSCHADLNNDTVVDGADLMDILANWGPAVE